MKPNPPVRTRVLIVDDSALARRSIRTMLEPQPDLEVVGEAADAFRAKVAIDSLRPDVVTLDLEMPGMDGLTFLRRLTGVQAPRVVVVSSISVRGSEAAIEAMSAGASEVVPKPSPEYPTLLMRQDLVRAVRAAAATRRPARLLSVRPAPRPPPPRPALPHPAPAPAFAARPAVRSARASRPPRATRSSERTILALGASTGGTIALERILEQLPANMPPIVIVQHMPPLFTEAFARRLDARCAITVREAKDGDVLARGLALIAPGGRHMTLRRRASGFAVGVEDGERIGGHCPSVNVLFDSVARFAGEHAIGALLTGMGADGADGLLAMRTANGRTIAQNEESCAVYGMPRAAFLLGATSEMVHLDDIAARLTALAFETSAA